MLQLHPDHLQGADPEELAASQARLQKVNAAWAVVSTAELRAAHDRRPAGQPAGATSPQGDVVPLGDLLGPGWLLRDRATVPGIRLGPITETRPFQRGSGAELWTYQSDLSALDRLAPAELAGLTVDAPVGDDALTHLVRFPHCTSIHLNGSRVTADGVAVLAALPALADLGLSDAPVGDEIGAVLPRFPALTELELGGTRVTEGIVPSLLKLPNLRRLGLRGTAVSSRGALALAAHPSLRDLALPGRVRWRVSRRLARQRPNLRLT